MKIRLHGTEDEVREAVERIRGAFTVLSVSRPYADRGESVLVRVYVEVRLDPPAAFVPSVQVHVEPDSPRQQAAIRAARRDNR